MVFLPANRADHFLWACQILPGLRQPLPKISRSRAPLDADNFRHREFPQALRRAGLCRVRFHDLRHTYTSLLIAHGTHPKYIQAKLDHPSIQTTLDRYGHLMPQLHQAEAQKLDELVFGSPAAPPARRLTAVRVGRAPRGGKKGGGGLPAGNHWGKNGGEKKKRVATETLNPR